MTNVKGNGMISAIFPQPRQASIVEGESELSADVRLATSDVLPFIRKTIRSGLSSAGIRVVANKKQFVVSINVVSPDELNFQGVSEVGRENYYELNVIDNMVEVRTHSQFGAIWGAQTFAAIFRSFGAGARISNLRVRDWSEQPWRGVFLETGWGLERMSPDQWTAMMDRLLRNKLNMFGLNLCGTVAHPVDGEPVDMLLASLPEAPELKTEIALRWYSPSAKKWRSETKLPRIFSDDLFVNISNSVREKGLRLIPGIDVVSLARILERCRNLKQVPGLETEQVREGLRSFCERLHRDYLREQTTPLLLSFGKLADETRDGHFYGKTPYQLEDFLIWFLEEVAVAKFDMVLVDGDELFGAASRLSPKFVGRLDELGLGARLSFLWRDGEERPANNESVAKGTAADGGAWLSPILCRDSWSGYRPRISELRKSCRGLAEASGEGGLLARCPFDPAYLDHIQLLAQLAWNPKDELEAEAILEQGSLIYGAWAEGVRAGTQALRQAVSSSVVRACFSSAEAGASATAGDSEAKLRELKSGGTEAAVSGLRVGAGLAADAVAALRPAADASKEQLDDFLIKTAGSLLAEAARVQGLTESYAALLEGDVGKARVSLLGAMQLVETYKPKALAAAALASFTRLLEYLE